MNTTDNIKLLELEEILTFLGIKFIDYKGRRTSDGHHTAKTIGEIKDFFGKEVMTSGQFIEDINWWDFENNWNDLMFLVEKIERLDFNFQITNKYASVLKNNSSIYTTNIYYIDGVNKIQAVYETCVKFVKCYNKKI